MNHEIHLTKYTNKLTFFFITNSVQLHQFWISEIDFFGLKYIKKLLTQKFYRKYLEHLYYYGYSLYRWLLRKKTLIKLPAKKNTLDFSREKKHI